MSCTNPHVETCGKCVRNMEPPVNLVRLDEGCDAAYICTDCKHGWQTAWGCA